MTHHMETNQTGSSHEDSNAEILREKEVLRKHLETTYDLKRQRDLEHQKLLRLENLSKLDVEITDAKNKYDVMERFYQNEFGRLESYIAQKISDLKGLSDFGEFKEFLKKVLVSSGEITEDAPHANERDFEKKQEEIRRKFAEQAMIIETDYKIHFDLFNHIIESLEKLHQERFDVQLGHVSTALELNKEVLRMRIKHEASDSHLHTLRKKPSVKSIEEIKNNTKEDQTLASQVYRDEHNEHYRFIKEKHEEKYQEIITKFITLYCNYDKSDIRKYGEDPDRVYNETTAIAVIIRANQIATGNLLREIQILAILEFLVDTKKFCQIDTGEGKTTITSALAVLRVLQGGFVDIITSNEVLAQEAINERGDFYALLGISVSHNNLDLDQPYAEGLKECYNHDVVYGTIGAFSFDYLHHHAEAQGTKVLALSYGVPVIRGCDTVIIDEADNVILDNYALMTNQAKSIAGVDQLKFVYIDIWQKLVSIEARLSIDPLTVTDEAKVALKKELDQSEIKEKIKQNNSLPIFLKDYINKRLDVLIDNAIKAKYDLHINEDYIIGKVNSEDNILPLEKDIGVRLQNFIWTDLHGFIQIKHNLHVNSCGSLTSVFIPNCVYLKLYTNIFGLSGTLGSEKERQFIRDVYGANSTIIPPFKSSLRDKSIKPIMAKDENKWLDFIESIADTYRHQRAVLFVCDTPKSLRIIEKKLLAIGYTEIVIYENESDAHKIERVNQLGGVQLGQIIISTNIGGRGTDIKLSAEVERNGGLHQVTTYLPRSERTENQAAGRAARSGQPGSVQIIFQCSELRNLKKFVLGFQDQTMIVNQLGEDDVLRAFRLRNEVEKMRLQSAQLHLANIEESYKQFQQFEAYYYVLKQSKEVGYFILEDLKLKFGLYYDSGSFEELDCLFQDLASNIEDDFAAYQFINPYFAVRHAQTLVCAGENNKAKRALSLPRVRVDENQFVVIPTTKDVNSFYRAVADQLKIKKQTKHDGEYYTHQELRVKTNHYVEANKEMLSGTVLSAHTIVETCLELNIALRLYDEDGKLIPPAAEKAREREIVINLQSTGSYYNSLVTLSESEKLDFYRALDALPAYHLTLFEVEISNSATLMSKIAGGITSIPFFSENTRDLAHAHLSKAADVLQRRLEDIKQFVASQEFQQIALEQSDEEHNLGHNMMQKHLESEQALFIAVAIHVKELLAYFENNPGKTIAIKKSYRFEQIIENGLEVGLPIYDIFPAEIALADSVGLGVYYELKALNDLSCTNSEANEARTKIVLGASMLLSAYIHKTRLISPGVAVAAGKLIRVGAKKLLSLILDDPDIYDEVDDVKDYIIDIALSYGGPRVVVPKILETVIIQNGQNFFCNYLFKMFENELRAQTKTVFFSPIKNFVEAPLKFINDQRELLLGKVSDSILSPIRQLIQQLKNHIGSHFLLHLDSLTARFAPTSSSDLLERIKTLDDLFKSIVNDIVFLKNTVLNTWSDCIDVFSGFKDLRTLAAEFITAYKGFKSGGIVSIVSLLNLIKNFIEQNLLSSIQVLMSTSMKLLKSLNEDILKLVRRIIDQSQCFQDKIFALIQEITHNPRVFFISLMNSIKGFVKEEILAQGYAIFEKMMNGFMAKIEETIKLVLHNNPIDKWLKKQGIDFSNLNSTINNLSSHAFDMIIKFIKSMLYQPKLYSHTASASRADASLEIARKESKVNQCVPFSISRLFGIGEEDLLRITRSYFSDIIIRDQGLKKWQTKLILENAGLKISEHQTSRADSYETIAHDLLVQTGSIGGVGLFVQKTNGHAFYIEKTAGSAKFIDSEHARGVDNVSMYDKGSLLIPINFTERKRDDLRRAIQAGDIKVSFSLLLILHRVWDQLFPSQEFGNNGKNIIQPGRNYPSGSIPVHQGGEQHKKALEALIIKLDEVMDSAISYRHLTPRRQRKTQEHNKGNTVTADRKKSGQEYRGEKGQHECMMGALEVKYKNKTIKLLAISGDTELKVREDGTVFNPGVLNGFKYVSCSKPTGQIRNLITGEETGEKWTNSCAAQKLFAYVATLARDSEIQSIALSEMYYSYGPPLSRNYSRNELVESCIQCAPVLPFLTARGSGSKSKQTVKGLIFQDDNPLGSHLAFYDEYTMEKIGSILRFRIAAAVSACRLNSLLILCHHYGFSEDYHNIRALFGELKVRLSRDPMGRESPSVVLAPLCLYGKHAVGIMLVNQDTGGTYKLFYIDPENTPIPSALSALFRDYGFNAEQLPTERQRYTNCGPEVIENFLLYLTGKRLSQEDAIVYHAKLIEKKTEDHSGKLGLKYKNSTFSVKGSYGGFFSQQGNAANDLTMAKEEQESVYRLPYDQIMPSP